MDRRREPRAQTYQTVQLTVLGDNRYSCRANVVQISGQGMRIVLEQAVPVSAAVKIACDDWLVLGEVCYCLRERSHYAVGVHLDQVLLGLHELAEQNLRFQDDLAQPVSR